MKASEDTLRLIEALDYAESSFWDAVAEKYPEATTGDLDPITIIDLSNHLRGALKRWIEYNVDEPEIDLVTNIMLHRIEYNYRDRPDMKLTSSDKEHIAYCISQGISEGELNTEVPALLPTEMAHGYWKINNNPE